MPNNDKYQVLELGAIKQIWARGRGEKTVRGGDCFRPFAGIYKVMGPCCCYCCCYCCAYCWRRWQEVVKSPWRDVKLKGRNNDRRVKRRWRWECIKSKKLYEKNEKNNSSSLLRIFALSDSSSFWHTISDNTNRKYPLLLTLWPIPLSDSI